jgi:FSR family fosmidomycin resistance protein-like MFS transporter
LLCEAAGNAALTIMLVMGAVGTLVGGGLVDRFGARAILVGTQVILLPLLVILPLAGAPAATVLLAAIGFVTIASFSITIVLGQSYLPSRPAFASGVDIGLAIGLGGIAATALGLLADAYGLHAVLWTVAVLPLPALLLSLTLPTGPPTVRRTSVRERRSVAQTAETGQDA